MNWFVGETVEFSETILFTVQYIKFKSGQTAPFQQKKPYSRKTKYCTQISINIKPICRYSYGIDNNRNSIVAGLTAGTWPTSRILGFARTTAWWR